MVLTFSNYDTDMTAVARLEVFKTTEEHIKLVGFCIIVQKDIEIVSSQIH